MQRFFIHNISRISWGFSQLRGPAHSFPPFILFWWAIFPFLDGLRVSCVTKNWTIEQQTASNFFTQWKSPLPHERDIVSSFQQHCLINSLIGNCQCMYFSIVHALMISNFCFPCGFGGSYVKKIFSERLSTMTTMKTSSCSLCLLFHNTVMALC